jgi:hypothetical protein
LLPYPFQGSTVVGFCDLGSEVSQAKLNACGVTQTEPCSYAQSFPIPFATNEELNENLLDRTAAVKRELQLQMAKATLTQQQDPSHALEVRARQTPLLAHRARF